MTRLTNKRVLLGVTGGIAAYKSADLIRRLQDEGADVRVVMTTAAQEFITPLTLQALSGHPVHLDLMNAETESVMGHIELARWADIVLIAPATADFIAKFVQGRGDDLLSTLCLAATCNIAIAPAMNQAMWTNKNTQQNIAAVLSNGVAIFQPDDGLQACGETGTGRLMDVANIVDHTVAQFAPGSLAGKKVVITAGPTREAIDPVRYISNHSSGRQGYALASAAIEAGASVTLVSGPTSLTPPDRAVFVAVESAEDMFNAVMAVTQDSDIFIGVAAVSDYKPEQVAQEKLKKSGDAGLTLTMVQNPDILKTVAASNNRPFTIGFAAETENLIEHAKEKLQRKNVDMIIANNVADTSIGFNSDDNEATVITRTKTQALPRSSKDTLARKLVELIAGELETK